MSIYQTKVLSETIISRYKPTRLAIKKLAGMLYFCKSTVADIEKYSGSGVVWKKRIKKYGKENIKTLWVSDWYHDAHEIQEIALRFSQENKIVESSQWANLKPEDGLDGGHPGDEAVKRTALKQTGVKHSAERNAAKSARQRGKKKSQQWLDNRSIQGGYSKTTYCWENILTGQQLNLTRYDFVRTILGKTNDSNISMVISGKQKSIKGWKITYQASVAKSR